MLNPGDRFGDYTVVRLLGQGGMGAVYLLQDAAGAQVAAKILDPATGGDHESRKRFLREAELALGVKHPNLVETYDVGEDPDTGLCYILMEYVPGGSLADRLKGGSLPINDAIRIVYQIATVLELARQKGIVHRDIKPANIMFDAEGTPKLADLGIARGGSLGTDTTTVTQTGMMIGTPAYMAPEQMLDAHNVDTRADIYSLGVVFYEMLTGERPNKDDTVVQLMAKAVKGEPLPDVRTLRPEVSASLAQLLAMMVAPDKDGRISTPGQITNALAIIERGGTFAAKPIAAKGAAKADVSSAGKTENARRPLPWKVLIPVCLLAGLAAAFFALAPKREQTKPMSVAKPVETVVRTVVRTNVVEKIVEKEAGADDRPRTKARIKDGVYRWKGPEGEWTYRVRNGLASIGDGKGCALYPRPRGRLTIPATICGLPVEGIAYGAFQDCKGLTAVEISEGILEIDRDVFKDCTSLAEVVLPVSMKKFGSWNFFGTPVRSLGLKRIDYWDGRIIGGMTNLVELKFDALNDNLVCEDGLVRSRDKSRLLFAPRSKATPKLPVDVTTLDAWSLCGEEVTVPRQITRVEPMAFGNCHVLRHVRFESPNVSIGYHAFHYAINLRQVDFPDGLREICAPKVFSNCSSLRAIRFPASVRKLGAEMFANCSSLRTVAFDGDAPELVDDGRSLRGRNIFKGTPRDLVVIVKRGSRGWDPGGDGLPKCWPVDAGNNARRIRYADEDTARVRAEAAIDSSRLRDKEPARAVQKTLDALFPGWKVRAISSSDRKVGFLTEFRGRRNLLVTHPPHVHEPAVLWRTVQVPRADPVLVLELSGHHKLSDFRLEVRVDGQSARTEDVSGADGFVRFVVDLGRWAGRQVPIEILHRPTGWNWEWAYWSRIEVLSSKSLAQSPAAKAKPLRPIMDYVPFLDSDDTRAVQKALDILAPGWKTSRNRSDGSIGFYEEFKHRYNVIKTHPPARGQPVVLTRQLKLVGSNPKLRLGVVNDYNADFHLTVCVDGTEILSRNVEGYEWKDIELDLSKWSGKDVRIEVEQKPTGWRDERAYWSRLEVVQDAAQSEGAEVKAVDAKRLCHDDTTKAVQKTLNVLFPGWKTSANRARNKGTSSVVGYVADYRGKRDLVCTLPPSEDEPVSISRRMRLPVGHPALRLSVCKNMTYQADFIIQVLVDGRKVHEERVNDGKWHEPVVNLSEWAGRDVKIEIRQCQLKDNAWGRAYWSKIAVE